MWCSVTKHVGWNGRLFGRQSFGICVGSSTILTQVLPNLSQSLTEMSGQYSKFGHGRFLLRKISINTWSIIFSEVNWCLSKSLPSYCGFRWYFIVLTRYSHGPYSESNNCSPHSLILLISKSTCCLRVGLQSGYFPSGLSPNNSHACPFPPMRTSSTWRTHTPLPLKLPPLQHFA